MICQEINDCMIEVEMRIVDLENAISLDLNVNFILNSCYLLLVFNSCHLIVLFKFLSFTYAFQVFVEILHLVLLSSHLLSCTLLSCTFYSLQFTFLHFNF
ncbi:uncharacterized protein DS421_4g130860 [Arachis hypogaea]|nr:uncharacterized protein DS421_4g130860 [Arachis hypogaea]